MLGAEIEEVLKTYASWSCSGLKRHGVGIGDSLNATVSQSPLVFQEDIIVFDFDQTGTTILFPRAIFIPDADSLAITIHKYAKGFLWHRLF